MWCHVAAPQMTIFNERMNDGTCNRKRSKVKTVSRWKKWLTEVLLKLNCKERIIISIIVRYVNCRTLIVFRYYFFKDDFPVGIV